MTLIHRPRKRFGQNFLHHTATLEAIVAALSPRREESLLEIGPGRGALTAALLPHLDSLHAIELDRDLVSYLQQRFPSSQLQLHSGDALKLDLADGRWPTPLRLVGNLPYNISTPLILHLIAQREQIIDMHFMLQKEVVERLVSAPGRKSYGRLSVIVQYYCQIEQLFTVPPSAFTPPPKVDSAIVRLIPYRDPPFPSVRRTLLEQVTQCAFNQRRKTLRNTLKPLFSVAELEQLGINPTLRADNVSVADYVTLALALDSLPTP
ncbi:16S rRNA (adenine(1518)-N(6)/adenine(1519)-N(6))-dimethyltransferase RsmA [Ectothiorhodospiraceae bacterium BW-2]|nr:16S rRNA (adenine(1518)-N(6)/adenine(1519)-N(6))-dimethyltransferase RsmA [Ectothiorhodospiraceae bacterium BW-2]